LKSDPKDVSALMAAAAISEHKGDLDAAIGSYNLVLEQYPEFMPACRRLVILLSTKKGDTKRAFDLALKARTAFPGDPELAKAYGIIRYRQDDFPRALGMLQESAPSQQEDADLMYYLGMTQFRLNDSAGAKQSLQRALELNARSELATEARRILVELK
jgi:tetratricopeptide (TPR) repeat protein